ncbi:putative rna-binding protein [Eutypa lata UCREL1]|uniref:Putative rna-binding protein n=1 Tax=Eutypa lata (strain UCR-EL1) TaxID=1287681 RepID=M7TDQ9_EUTLA|nr:putative rna-binding protein [Eutypa lata UCREL1]
MSTQEIDQILRDKGAVGLVEVRVKSDDKTGSRRCYAFAEFQSDDGAIDFVEKHYPAIDISTPNGPFAQIHIEYSRERRSVANPDDWACAMCHFQNFSRRATCKQCKAPKSTIAESTAEMRLDGKSDECPQQAPSPFLVIRDLPSSANENTLSNGIKSLYVAKGDEPKQTPGAPPKLKSTAPVGNTSGLGAKPGSLVRVFLIRERSSEISCNYGFVEFATLEDARAAMAKYLATPQFTISSRPVTLAYIHSGVFIPHLYPVQEHDKYSFAATHNPSMRLVYWNPSVFASELTVFNESLYEDKPQGSAASQRDAEQAAKDTKKRKAEKELAAPSGKKVIAMAPQLQRWANKHAELHSSKEGSKLKEPPNDKTPATGPNAVGSTQASRASPPAPSTAPSISYADLDQMCCLLCRRKFRNEPSLRRHEQSSDMHKANLDNEGLISKATTDLKALGKEPVSNYRDRAKERRRVHNQPMKPKPQLPKKNPTPSTKEKDAAPAKPVISKGAGLLAKMGWNSGEGLGAEGGGRTNLVETLAYNPGVGLGAEGGKLGDAAEEAARATTNEYSDFVAKAKDKARERYERMG